MESTNTAKQIERMTDAVTLKLPRSFQLKMHDVFEQELAGLPAHTRHEIRVNAMAAVALVLRTAKTDEIYQAEADRIRLYEQTMQEVDKYGRLNIAKERNRKIVEFFEVAMHRRSLPMRSVDESFSGFCSSISTDQECVLLIEWASNLYRKRKELSGEDL